MIFVARLKRLGVLSLLFSINPVWSEEENSDISDSNVRPYQSYPSLSLQEFQSLLFTEVDDEVEVVENSFLDLISGEEKARNLQQNQPDETPEMQFIWEHMIEHGWSLIHAHEEEGRRLADDPTIENVTYPFLICSRSPLLRSGTQRLDPVVQLTGTTDITVVSNNDEQTCFHTVSSVEKANLLSMSISTDEYAVIPMVDLMKISKSTIQQVMKDGWSVPSAEQRVEALKADLDIDWERTIHVEFTSKDTATEDDTRAKAIKVLQDIQDMGHQGNTDARRRLSIDQSDIETIVTIPQDRNNQKASVFSISNTFSLTSDFTLPEEKKSRRMKTIQQGRKTIFQRALSSGIEADHGCNAMFEDLDIIPTSDSFGFKIVLNPDTNSSKIIKDNDTITRTESSASNVHCIISLIMGLSTHRNVLTIEVEDPITPDDYESQWISQSNVKSSRPFFDVGLTGKGQIVSISDSGLDIGHAYFGPTSSSVFQNWQLAERKVVKYVGYRDTQEMPGGHGTRVAGILAGRLASNVDNEADGVARDAKLHLYDLQKQNGGFASPDANKLFSDIYNNGKGAKITNASWSSPFRSYSTRCRMIDAALSTTYNDILFVSSAGNYGNDDSTTTTTKVGSGSSTYKTPLKTIGDPASCKNVIAVGASQSDGERIYTGDKGIKYLADFSSRGPTMDGRMKPDIVAPGYTVLTARAHASGSNEAYETLGTSFSSPVIAGCAALIRQYFEEGWFPCGFKNCASSSSSSYTKNSNQELIRNPSGSFVKAILLNGGSGLTQVQKVPRGVILESLKEYDMNQGFGLVNLLSSLPVKNKNVMNAMGVNQKSINDGQVHSYRIQASSSSSCGTYGRMLSTTLVWYDPAGAVNCASCLMNDLDLWVEKEQGGGNSSSSTKYYPNGGTGPDRKNTAERVRLTMVSGGVYTIFVKGYNLSTASQKYSLIATGCFTVLDGNNGDNETGGNPKLMISNDL